MALSVQLALHYVTIKNFAIVTLLAHSIFLMRPLGPRLSLSLYQPATMSVFVHKLRLTSTDSALNTRSFTDNATSDDILVTN